MRLLLPILRFHFRLVAMIVLDWFLSSANTDTAGQHTTAASLSRTVGAVSPKADPGGIWMT